MPPRPTTATRLLVWVAVLALAAALTGAVLAFTERRLVIPRGLRTAFAACLVVVALAGAAWVTVAHGPPWRLAEKGWNQFRAEPKATKDLSNRLFDLSSNGRTELWGVSWHDFTTHPVAGRGASSFEQSFYERRESTGTARDGHSLYAETLGELGVVGLGLLVIALLAPLVAAVRARHRRVVPGAAAAYVAYLVHAAVDWDWELAGVTLVALLTACGLVAVARPRAVRATGAAAAVGCRRSDRRRSACGACAVERALDRPVGSRAGRPRKGRLPGGRERGARRRALGAVVVEIVAAPR